MTQWPLHYLAEVASLFNGKTPSKEDQRENGHPVLKIKDVSALGRFRGRFESFVEPGYASQYSTKFLQEGDSLILNAAHNKSHVASKIYFAETEALGSLITGEWLTIRPKRDIIDSSYLNHWLTHPKTRFHLRRLVNGIHLYPKDVSRLQLPVPPLTQQRRIAEVLDRADELRERRRLATAHLDELTESVFLDIFKISTETSPWPVHPVEQICELVVDCVNRTAPTVDRITPFKMIRTTNVKNGLVNLQKVRYVEEETFLKWNRRTTPQYGDVILTREAPVGEAGILKTHERVFLGQRLMLYRTDPRITTPEYLLGVFMSPFMRRQFHRYGSGSTVKHLPLPACRSFDIPLPPINLQRRYSAQVEALESLKLRHAAQLDQLDELFLSHQTRAFRGEL